MAWRLGSKKSAAKADSSSLAEDERKPLPAVTRDFFLEHPDIAALTPEQVAAERQKHSIVVQGDAVPNPVSRFVQASLPPYLLDTLLAAGYKEPTAIQRQAWPVAMSGRDLVGLAETGSGKTLAYLLPALVHVIAQPMLKEGEGPLALVLAPTRELAVQIHEEAVRFGQPCGVRTVRFTSLALLPAGTINKPSPRLPIPAPPRAPAGCYLGCLSPMHQPVPPA
jgi:ATP-dependent RNA helicase DDX5/DBP2